MPDKIDRITIKPAFMGEHVHFFMYVNGASVHGGSMPGNIVMRRGEYDAFLRILQAGAATEKAMVTIQNFEPKA